MRVSRAAAVTLTVIGIACIYALAVRPAFLNWGATVDEQARVLAGDDLARGRQHRETRAITIAAPSSTTWAWVSQLGQDRGGFYSYDVLENLVGCEMPTEDVLRPDRQQWAVNDRLWMYPPDKAGGIGFATLRRYEPGRLLAFGTHVPETPIDQPDDGVWTFAVEPIDATTSRLLVRTSATAARAPWGAVFDHAIFEPVHFIMERRMMTGIKQIAEGGSRERRANTAHVVAWTALFLMIVTAFYKAVRDSRWQWPLLLFAIEAFAFQFLTLAQPSTAVTVVTVLVFALGHIALSRFTESSQI